MAAPIASINGRLEHGDNATTLSLYAQALRSAAAFLGTLLTSDTRSTADSLRPP